MKNDNQRSKPNLRYPVIDHYNALLQFKAGCCLASEILYSEDLRHEEASP